MINKEELLVLDGLLHSDPGNFTAKWNHVRGHQGIEGNEGADALARQGARQQ